MKKKVYISGQMSGLSKEEYFARFHRAEILLQEQGFCTVNPARFCVCKYEWIYNLFGYKLTLVYDIWRMSRCDFIYKIPGWQQSKGANIESCWAYHLGPWTLPVKIRESLDKKMCKFIEKREKNE